MFLTSPLAQQFSDLIEREDFLAIDELYEIYPSQPAANWFYLKSLLLQTKPKTAYEFTKSILQNIEPDDHLLFKMQLEFLSFYNGRSSGSIDTQLQIFVNAAEDINDGSLVNAFNWFFAASLIEFGVRLGKFPSTMFPTILEYHGKSAWDERSYYKSILKRTEVEFQNSILTKPSSEILAAYVEQATAKGFYNIAGELCLYHAELLFRGNAAETDTLFEKASSLLKAGKHVAWNAKVWQVRGALLLEYGRMEGLDFLNKAKIIYKAAGHWHKLKTIVDLEISWYTKTVEREQLIALNDELDEILLHIELPVASGSAKVAKLKAALDNDDMDAIIRIGESITSDDDWLIQNILQITANALSSGGRVDKAIELCERVVTTFLPANPNPSLAHAYSFLADQYAKCRDYHTALKNLDLAYKGYENLNDVDGMSMIVRRKLEYLIQEAVNNGTILEVTQQFIDLIDLTLTRLVADASQSSQQLRGGIYQVLGQAHALLGQYDNATTCFSTAERCFIENNLISDAAALWPHLTLHLISIARKEKSISRYDEALDYAEKALQYTLPGHFQMLYRLNFHKGICLYESGRLITGDERKERFTFADEAFEIAANCNERMFRHLDNSTVSNRQETSAYFIKDKQTLYEQAFILNYHYRNNYARALHWVQLQKMQTVLSEFATNRKDVSVLSKSIQYEDLRKTLLEKERLLNGQKIVIFEYYCIQQNIYVFTIRSDWNAPAGERVPLSVETVRERQSSFISDNRIARATASGALSLWWQEIKLLVQAISIWSNPGDLIYLMPHGVIQNLPVHTLLVDKNISLAERNPIMWAPSFYILHHIWKREMRNDESCNSSVIFGDPSNNLTWARKEALEIASLFGTTPIMGDNVTKATFFEKIACCSILHFCGHGHFISQNGLDSYIEIAKGDKITPRDMMENNVNPNTMVVLSGCETGLNQSHEGDEMMGLTRGVLLAGVDTLIVSLWKVGDEPTLKFFKLFYQHLFSSNDKTKAFFQTIIELKSDGYNFYVWGAFVMIGNF